MHSVDDTIKLARLLANQENWSRYRITTEAGIGISRLVNLDDDARFNPNRNTIRKLERVVFRAVAEGIIPAAV